MATWNFDFSTEDSFITTDFTDADALFLSGGDSIDAGEFSTLPIKNITEKSFEEQKEGDLNVHLGTFFSSLGQSADKLQVLQKNLKGQLDDCRNWFKDAILTGMTAKSDL